MCSLFCWFGFFTICGCRDHVARKLVYFPPHSSYCIEEEVVENDRNNNNNSSNSDNNSKNANNNYNNNYQSTNPSSGSSADSSMNSLNTIFYLVDPFGHKYEPLSSSIHHFDYKCIKTPASHSMATLFIKYCDPNGEDRSPVHSRTTLLFAHGNATDLGCMRSHLFDLSAQLSVNIFAFDYAGYGCSTGTPSQSHTFNDVITAYHYLRTTYPQYCQTLILYGQSLGSGPILHLASKFEVDGIILHSAIASALRVIDISLDRTPWYDLYPNVDLIKVALGSPRIFIIHGEKDEEVHVAHGRKLYENCTNPYPAWYPPAGHNDIEIRERDAYLIKIREFLDVCESRTTGRQKAAGSAFEQPDTGRYAS